MALIIVILELYYTFWYGFHRLLACSFVIKVVTKRLFFCNDIHRKVYFL